MLATFRSIDGTGNNLLPPRSSQGAADTNLIRFGYDAEFPDGYGDEILESPERPNARDISNVLSAQSQSVPNDRNLSDWIVQWGQFLTHDMDLTGTDSANNNLFSGGTGDFSIPVTDDNDPLGPNPIPFNRSDFDPTTGDTTQIPRPGPGGQTRPNWREQVNEVTSYIDASNVYGSDAVRADNLRTFVDGKLKTSAGGLLPGLNDVGEENDNAVGATETSLFLAGDVRANEQIGLTATHALFVREHNRLADLLKLQNPTFTDEEIYQWARKIVGAQMQIITYEEFLPALMGSAAPNPDFYQYSATADASITTSFSTAFFRFGHSMQSSTLRLVDNSGVTVGNMPLREIFFNPALLQNDPELVEHALKGLGSQVAQENDVLLVDDIRNFLFGPPGAGGLDLGALDIQRGRDHGLLDYREFRRTYRLQPVNSFAQLTSDTTVASKLQTLYGTIDNVDAFIGGLAEDHLPGSSVGHMLQGSFIDQFTRLRDGDRFFYTGDADLQNPIVTNAIDLSATTLSEIIKTNTSITNLQDNVFFTAPGVSISQSDGSTVVHETGTSDVFTVVLNSQPTADVTITLTSNDTSEGTVSPDTITFTPANWMFPQNVIVTGVDDVLEDGDVTFQVITSTATGGDYQGLDVNNVTVVNTDDEFVADLDIDGNNNADAATDGILMLRYLFGFRGTALTSGAIGQSAANATPESVEAALDASLSMLDADGNGVRDAATDGILILRYLFGFRGAALIDSAIGSNATRTTETDIASFLSGFMPPAASPVVPQSAAFGQTTPSSSSILTDHSSPHSNWATIADDEDLFPSDEKELESVGRSPMVVDEPTLLDQQFETAGNWLNSINSVSR